MYSVEHVVPVYAEINRSIAHTALHTNLQDSISFSIKNWLDETLPHLSGVKNTNIIMVY